MAVVLEHMDLQAASDEQACYVGYLGRLDG